MLIDLDTMTQEQFDEYRARCDGRNAAEFRYRREVCGIELSELSEDLGVRLDTVKRWENPNKGMPPSLRAWAYVDSWYLTLLDAIEAAIQRVEDESEANGGDIEPVHLSYRRGAAKTGSVPTWRSNAFTKAAGIALTALGYEIEVDWKDDGAAGA